MNASFEPGILSPSSQYLQDGGSQQTSMSTPRPGTPRGSYFRLSPDGNLNPGTPGAASHDHHGKFPNSPWSGSEPATPGAGSGYNRNSVVPNSPYIPSYPNTPATPGGGGFIQKQVNGGGNTMPPSNGNAVVPGSPWTDRSVCTPGPMTPLTPATPIHSSMSDMGNSSNGFSNNGSPTFQLDSINSNNNGGKGMQQVPHHSPPHSSTLAGLLQEGADSNLPVPVMNHSVQTAALPPPPPPAPSQNENVDHIALPSPTLPLLSDTEISQVVDNNPNLISEFEEFFAEFMSSKNAENNVNQNQSQQQSQLQSHLQQQQLQQPPPQIQQQQQQQPQMQQQQSHNHQLVSPMGMANNGHAMMYNNSMPHNSVAGQSGMMMNNAHLMNGMHMGNSVGPMRQNKFHQSHHGHPYMMPNNNGNIMMRNRQLPGHMQYGQPPQPSQSLQQHLHQNMGNNMNMMGPGRPQQAQFNLQGHNNPSASVYAHTPSGNNGGYVQVRQQPMQTQHMGNPTYPNVQQNPNSVPVHWQQQQQQPQPPQQQQQQQQQQQMSNLNSAMGMMGANGVMSNNNNRGIPQQPPNSYFQNPVNPIVNGSKGEQGLSNGQSVLPPNGYTFDLNGGGNGVGTINAMNPTTSAMQGTQVPVQPASLSSNLGAAPQSQPNSNNPIIPVVDLDLEGLYDGSSISQSTWNKAADKASSRNNPVAEVGKVLFDDIFSDDEVIQCTLSGRGSTEKFNPNKVHYLKRAVAWLLTRPQRPWEFNFTTCEHTLSQEDESGTKGLDKKVFTEYRSRRRGDILKARNQNTS